MSRGLREEEKFRARGTRNLARTLETGTRARVSACAREQVRRLSPGEDSRECRSTSLTPRILHLRNPCGLTQVDISKTSLSLSVCSSLLGLPICFYYDGVRARARGRVEEGARVKLEFSSRALF